MNLIWIKVLVLVGLVLLRLSHSGSETCLITSSTKLYHFIHLHYIRPCGAVHHISGLIPDGVGFLNLSLELKLGDRLIGLGVSQARPNWRILYLYDVSIQIENKGD